MKCHNILFDTVKNFEENEGKTSLVEDINDYKKKFSSLSKINKEILQFSISQKKIMNYHKKMFVNRMIKEINKDIWGVHKTKYI